MPTYEYICVGRHRSTARRGYEDASIPCETCGEPAQRAFANVPYIHGMTTPTNQLSVDQLDPERFLDRAEYIDDAYVRADAETGRKVKRPKGYKAGIVRARAMQIEREGFNHKSVVKLNKLDAKAV